MEGKACLQNIAKELRDWWGENQQHFYKVSGENGEKWEHDAAHLAWLLIQHVHVLKTIYLARKLNKSFWKALQFKLFCPLKLRG